MTKTVAIVVLLLAAAPAQTFVVDANNGPGTNFTSIAAAVATVPDGAVLDVRPGTYSTFTIAGKSVAVIGGPGVWIYDLVGQVRVTALQTGQTVVLRGLEVAQGIGHGTIVCQSSRGVIVIDDCHGNSTTSTLGGSLYVADCEHVSVRGCWFGDTLYPANVIDSNVTFTHCLLSGSYNGVGIYCTDSHVTVSNCLLWSALSSTVLMNGGELAVTGNSTLRKSAVTMPGAVVSGTGNVRIHPNTVIQAATATPFVGVTATFVPMPEVGAWTDPLGGTATATLVVPPGGIGVLFVGIPSPPQVVAGLPDPIWIRPGSEILQATGAGTLAASYAVPNAPCVLGITVAWQGVTTGTGGPQVGNPVVYVHY